MPGGKGGGWVEREVRRQGRKERVGNGEGREGAVEQGKGGGRGGRGKGREGAEREGRGGRGQGREEREGGGGG